MSERFVLILAGGRGERFWPWSRPERPKQLLPLARGGRTLLASTVERALGLAPPANVLVLTARDLADAVRRECEGQGVRVLGEPVARNTAPAIGAAAIWFAAQAEDPVFAVLPADHAIDDVATFRADLSLGLDLAEREPVLVTFAIQPAAPEPSLGYLRRGARTADRVYRVRQFTEKPERAVAARWIGTGEYYWNSGIFAWRCSTLLEGLESARPALARPLRELSAKGSLDDFAAELERVFPGLESISVDYAVMEQAPNAVMVEAGFDWDDLGSWSAWARRQPRDARGNVLFGEALALDCERCVVVGEGGTAAARGLKDMVVVHAAGATLSCRLEDSNDVRRIAEASRQRGKG
jgi:mannose-1-phosphate guanylyltransferase